jgi:hypothetical protein
MPGSQIGLWGFGLFYGDARLGGLFLKRYKFTPKLTLSSQLPADILKVGEMPELQTGADYRQQSVRAWHRKAVMPAGEMAAAWQALARKCEDLTFIDGERGVDGLFAGRGFIAKR